jgi:hypothetical protein
MHSQDRSFKKIALSQDRIAFSFEPPMKAKKQVGLGASVFFFGNFLTVMINFQNHKIEEKKRD